MFRFAGVLVLLFMVGLAAPAAARASLINLLPLLLLIRDRMRDDVFPLLMMQPLRPWLIFTTTLLIIPLVFMLKAALTTSNQVIIH